MLARFHVALPFVLTLPDGEVFSIHGYEDEGYQIYVYPPVRSDKPSPSPGSVADGIYIDEKPAFQADTLQIDFRKDDFDRRGGIECDPPYHLIQRTINIFLRKVRFVTRGFQVTPIYFPQALWRLRYLNDDGTELEKVEGLVKGRGAIAFHFSWIVITPMIWEDIHRLAVDYAPPEWDGLYLDAVAALPDIGPSIMLAVTSLEVFISHVLDALAMKDVTPPQLWRWINNRQWLREPTVEEQFDELLKLLLGTSLKENSTLWKAFKHLKTARNSFVHSGVAQIGKKPVTENEAQRLVEHAAKIVSFIRAKLPEELQWPEYQHKVTVRIAKKLLGD